jgi:hypothetical protein
LAAEVPNLVEAGVLSDKVKSKPADADGAAAAAAPASD